MTAASAVGPLGPAAPWRAAHLGERGGDEMSGAPSVRSRPQCGLVLLSPVLLRRRGRDQARLPRAGVLPPAPRRPETASPFELLKLRTMHPGRRPGRGRHARAGGRPPGHPGRRLPAPLLAGRAAEPDQRRSAATSRSWAPGRRSRPRSSSTRRTSAAGWRCRPGITGWAQVNGRAGIPWEERIELDVWYVDNRSALLDLRILLRDRRAAAHRPRPLRVA